MNLRGLEDDVRGVKERCEGEVRRRGVKERAT
jgi:hypothetical protein